MGHQTPSAHLWYQPRRTPANRWPIRRQSRLRQHQPQRNSFSRQRVSEPHPRLARVLDHSQGSDDIDTDPVDREFRNFLQFRLNYDRNESSDHIDTNAVDCEFGNFLQLRLNYDGDESSNPIDTDPVDRKFGNFLQFRPNYDCNESSDHIDTDPVDDELGNWLVGNNFWGESILLRLNHVPESCL